MAQMNEIAARIMEHLCTCSNHGYTWGDRWGNGNAESITVDGKRYTFAGGDRDCSSAIISAYKAAGLDVGATYTGNMRSAFLATGLFEWMPMSFTAQRGDIYLNEQNHTAMCVSASPDRLAEFCINEHGGCYGGTVGDQTGGESRIADYYDYPWDGILHFKGGDMAQAKWIHESGGKKRWWYRHADGSYTKSGWELIGNRWYYFDSDGWMKTGWITYKGNKYYLQPKSTKDHKQGEMRIGWVQLDGEWYWFDESGAAARKCCMQIGGKWYAFGADCSMLTKLTVSKNGDIEL